MSLALSAAVIAAAWPVSARWGHSGAAGPVRVEGRSFADDDGPFTVLGATLFWGAWGYRHDRARLERNLEYLAAHGVDAIRVLAAVGPSGGWDDRVVDPGWPDYDAVVTGLTDLAYDRFGLRVEWTVFGGVDATPSADDREALVTRLAGLLASRADKVLFIEIANEGYQNGFGDAGGIEELRVLGERLAASGPLLVALTAPQNDEAAPFSAAAVYRGAAVDVGTLHHDRDVGGAHGAWRPVRVPWSVVGMREVLPPVLVSNEPIGPASSVSDESDPARLAGAALVSWLAGHSAYVFHAGPGVRGGGAADRDRGRRANFFDAPETARQLDALAVAQDLMPDDIANWQPVASDDARHPFRGSDDVFCAVREARFVCVVLAPEGARAVTASRALEARRHDPVAGAELAPAQLAAGDILPVPASPSVVVLSGATTAGD
jgi:hypothetical protein